MLLRPEEMYRYSERERTRLAAERHALLESIRSQQRQKRQASRAGRRSALAGLRGHLRLPRTGWRSRGEPTNEDGHTDHAQHG